MAAPSRTMARSRIMTLPPLARIKVHESQTQNKAGCFPAGEAFVLYCWPVNCISTPHTKQTEKPVESSSRCQEREAAQRQ